VVQDLRGRFASEGSDSTFWTDGWGTNQDGYDTIEWAAARSWSNGRIGTYGESARGIVQYLAAGAAPPHLEACVALIGCDDFYQKAFFQGGAYREQLVDGWFASIDAEEMLPFFRAHPTRDGFWDAFDLRLRANTVQVPILHIGGHYDIFGESAIDAFTYLSSLGGSGASGQQRLVLGPWSHYGIFEQEQGELTYPTNAASEFRSLIWRWFDHHLKDVANGVDAEPPVDYYLMGDVDNPASPGNRWVSAATFPESEMFVRTYYVHGPSSSTPRSLSTIPPTSTTDALWYSNDPSNPIPTRGGRNLDHDAGPADQRPVHDPRADDLVVMTEPLIAPTPVAGNVRFRFWATTSVVDTDWCVKLVDVYPDGRQMLVTDGVLQARYRNGFETAELMTRWEIYEFEVDLWSTALVFEPGHRIMLALTSSNYPRFAVNPQTGVPFGTPSGTEPATIGIGASTVYPSRLLLPIMPFDWVGLDDRASLDDGRTHPLRIVPLASLARTFRVRLELPRGLSEEPALYAASGRLAGRFSAPLGSAGTMTLTSGSLVAPHALAPGVYFLRVRDLSGQSGTGRLILGP
jgi:predicted acyl esterase